MSSFVLLRLLAVLVCLLCYSSNGEGITANSRTVGNGRLYLRKLLRRRRKNVGTRNHDAGGMNKALFRAAYNGHVDDAKYAIENGADVNGKGRNGWTAMHKACAMGHLKIITLLLNKGADVNLANKYGETPAIYCAGYSIGTGVADVKCVKLMKKLHNACADIEKPSRKGWTPLDAAKQSYNKRCTKAIKKLITQGIPSSCDAN